MISFMMWFIVMFVVGYAVGYMATSVLCFFLMGRQPDEVWNWRVFFGANIYYDWLDKNGRNSI